MLEWALERFAPRIAISTAFQIDGVALIDMAYEIDPEIRVFTVDTGRLPQETFELIEQLRDRYPGLQLELLAPEPGQVERMVGRHGPDLFYRLGRAAPALLQRPQGAAADPAPRRPRRLDHRPAPRPVGDPHEHPQGRDRPRPRRDRQAQPARRVDGGGGLGLRPRARRARTTRSTTAATRRSAARPARAPTRAGEPSRAGRWWWETNAPKECGIHCAIETGGFEHELHAILGEEEHR